jgi:hypothetical protein
MPLWQMAEVLARRPPAAAHVACEEAAQPSRPDGRLGGAIIGWSVKVWNSCEVSDWPPID